MMADEEKIDVLLMQSHIECKWWVPIQILNAECAWAQVQTYFGGCPFAQNLEKFMKYEVSIECWASRLCWQF